MRRSAVSDVLPSRRRQLGTARAPRGPPPINNALIGGQPWWNNWAWMRCCQARRSSIRVQYNRPRVRTSSTCAGGIHDSGNRPSNSKRAQQPRIGAVGLGALLRPRNAAISAGSPRCTPTPAAGQLLADIPPPGAALQRELRVPVRAVLGQPAPQRLPRRRTDLTPAHQPVVIHVIERDLLSVHVKPPTIVIGTSSSSRNTPDANSTCVLAEGSPSHVIFLFLLSEPG